MVLATFTAIATTAFADDVSANTSSAPIFTNVQDHTYTLEDGTLVTETTFYEDGIFSKIEIRITLDGTYTVSTEHGGEYKSYSRKLNKKISPTTSPIINYSGNNIMATSSRNYTYWGQEKYSINVKIIKNCSSATDVAYEICSAGGFASAQLILGLARILFSQIDAYYEQFGNNAVLYFTSNKYYDSEYVGTNTLYYHLVNTNVYSNSSRTNLIKSVSDTYEATRFYF